MIEETLKVKVVKEHYQFLHKLNMSALYGNCERGIPKSVLLIHTYVFRTIKLYKIV